MDNALKAVSMTDDELRVANYMILFGSENQRDLEGVMGGHKNFLINSVASFYQVGNKAKAAKIYKLLREKYSTGPHSEDFSDPLLVFVRKRMAEELRNVGDKDAVEQIIMPLREGYFEYAIHEDEKALGRENWAKVVYDIYQKETGWEEDYRMGLPDFAMMRYLAFIGFMNDPFYPQELKARLLGRIKLERPDLFEKLIKQEGDFFEKYGKPQEPAP